MEKNLFEKWRDKELPEEIQEKTDGFSSQGKSYEEKIFRAGFHCGAEINKIKEVLGIAD
jgi:hypothetical protein